MGAAIAVGTIAFGGSTVTTGFTSVATGNSIHAQAGSVVLTVTNGNIDVTGLFPGDQPQKVKPGVNIANNGTINGLVTVKFGQFHAASGNPDPSKLMFHITGLGDISAQDLAGSTQTIGVIPAGQSNTYVVTVWLRDSAGNDWNNADVHINYTVTMTASS
jgi:hypothetical protein